MGRRVWVAKDSLRTTAEELQKIVESRAQKTLKKIVKQPLHPVRESQSSATITITWSTWLLSTATSFLITSTCQHSSAPLYLHSLHTPSSSGLPFTTPNSHQTQNYLPVPLTFQMSCYPPAILLRSSPLVPGSRSPTILQRDTFISLQLRPFELFTSPDSSPASFPSRSASIPPVNKLVFYHLPLVSCLCVVTHPQMLFGRVSRKILLAHPKTNSSIFSYHSDTTGTSNGTCFYGQMKQKNELFSSKHSRWVWWTRG